MTDLKSDVLAAARSNPDWTDDLDWTTYYAQLPDILADQLDNLVTLPEVITGAYKWAMFLLQEDAPSKLFAFLKDPDLDGLSILIGDPVARMRQRLHNDERVLVLFAQGKAKVIPEKSERHSLIGYGLKGAALHEYDKGTLTVRDLLRLCPLVIAPIY
jgi:hypothetical protein